MNSKFDISSDALVALKKAGATESELKAVLAQTDPDVGHPSADPSPAPSSTNDPSLAAASSVSSNGPSYAETVKWIQDHIRNAGIPAFGTTPATSQKHFMALSFSPYKYDIRIDGCNSMSIVETFAQYFDSYDSQTASTHRDETDITITTVIPMRSAQLFFSNTHVDAKWLEDGSPGFRWIADGAEVKPSWLSAIKDSMGRDSGKYWVALTPVQENPKTDGVYSDTRGAVFVVPQDGGIRVTRVTNPLEDPPMIPSQPKIDVPLNILLFENPGSEGENSHMAKALQHLITLCRQNPDVAPRDIF